MARILDYSAEEEADFKLQEALPRLRKVQEHYETRAELVREAVGEMSLNPKFELGVSKKDVNGLLRRPGVDGLHEKARISRNRRRKAKLTAKKKPMTRKKAQSRTRRLTKK